MIATGNWPDLSSAEAAFVFALVVALFMVGIILIDREG